MAEEERIRLPGGGDVLVRPLAPSDRERLRRGFERLGEESRYLRFLAPKKALSSSELSYLTDVDHVDHEAIGAIDAETDAGVGVARYVRSRDDATVAEAAVVVADDWQGRGLGRLLLDRLAERARANGVERFGATLLIVNDRMRHLLEQVGTVTVIRQGEGTIDVDVEFPVAHGPLHSALSAAARREAVLSERA